MMRQVVALLLTILPVAALATQRQPAPYQEHFDIRQLYQDMEKKRIELADQRAEYRSSETYAIFWPVCGLSAFLISAVSAGAYCESEGHGTGCVTDILGHWAYVFAAGNVAHGILNAMSNWIIRGRKVAHAAGAATKATQDYNREIAARRQRLRNVQAVGRPIPQAYAPQLPTTGLRQPPMANQAWPDLGARSRARIRSAPALPHLDSRGNLQPCTICQEDNPQTPVVATPCRHTFCRVCIETWRDAQFNRAIEEAAARGTYPDMHFTCPNCNAEIQSIDPVAQVEELEIAPDQDPPAETAAQPPIRGAFSV